MFLYKIKDIRMIGRPALQVLSVVAAEEYLTEKVKCV